MSQVSGSISFDFDHTRLARAVGAEVVEQLDRYDFVSRLADLVAERVIAAAFGGQQRHDPAALDVDGDGPGGFAIGGERRTAGSDVYDREPGGDQ